MPEANLNLGASHKDKAAPEGSGKGGTAVKNSVWRRSQTWILMALAAAAITVVVVWKCWQLWPTWFICIVFPLGSVALLLWWLLVGHLAVAADSIGNKYSAGDFWAPPPRWFSVLLLAALVIGLVKVETWRWWIAAQAIVLVALAFVGWWVWAMLRSGKANDWGQSGGQSGRGDFFSNETFVKLLQFVAVGVIAIIIYAIQFDHWNLALVAQTAGGGILTAGAALIAGALLGFLFGIPRTNSEGTAKPPADSSSNAKAGGGQDSATAQATPQAAGNTADPNQAAVPNTNLEQISDWLTKTIVGVSLVELKDAGPWIWKVATRITNAIDPTHSNPALALVILVYFSAAGFLIAYLWTRLQLTWAFGVWARRELDKQSKSDAFTIATVDRWVNQSSAMNDDRARTQLLDAIRLGSPSAKVRAFLDAERRRERLNSTDKKADNDAALAVFKALVDDDGAGVFHRNRSQYAYCLMGKTNPDWASALGWLNEAIRIRDRSSDPGWKEYEFARAACRAELARKPNSPALIDNLDSNANSDVLNDLKVATILDSSRKDSIYSGDFRNDFDKRIEQFKTGVAASAATVDQAAADAAAAKPAAPVADSGTTAKKADDAKDGGGNTGAK